MTNHILTETKAQILTLTINRPDKKNALTRAMYAALAEAINQANSDPGVRVLLITGSGDS
ncbi:MAG: enoyl-CoA hydratase/isomerase family protein, partial [Anaerolineales bacterium]|nr:enoyl-CoA hydratase/isomerase family protein [Anaerolineales bacterium]